VTTRCIDDRYTAPLECLKLECSLDLKSNQDEAAGTEHAARGGQ
jgi:hypothetical protein